MKKDVDPDCIRFESLHSESPRDCQAQTHFSALSGLYLTGHYVFVGMLTGKPNILLIK